MPLAFSRDMTKKDISYAKGYVGQVWRRLEIEEQAHARRMMRAGLMTIVGHVDAPEGDNRRIVWTAASGQI